jgi:hypothetical protein
VSADRLGRLVKLEEVLGRRPGRNLEARVAAARQRLIAWTNAAIDLPLAEILAGRDAVRDAIDRGRGR